MLLLYRSLYNDVNATVLWLVVVHDLIEFTYMDDVTRNLFSLWCSTWRAVLWNYFGLKQVKASKSLEKKFRKMEKRTQKEPLTNWECLNYQESSQKLPSCVIATRDSLFCKMFSPLFCFEQEKTLKNFSKKLYTSNIKKKGRRRDEI